MVRSTAPSSCGLVKVIRTNTTDSARIGGDCPAHGGRPAKRVARRGRHDVRVRVGAGAAPHAGLRSRLDRASTRASHDLGTAPHQSADTGKAARRPAASPHLRDHLHCLAIPGMPRVTYSPYFGIVCFVLRGCTTMNDLIRGSATGRFPSWRRCRPRGASDAAKGSVDCSKATTARRHRGPDETCRAAGMA